MDEIDVIPAGGAALDEILIAGAMAGVVILVFGWITWRERGGHTTLVGRFADWLSTKDGLPRWAGLPSYMLVAALLCAGFGVWWDVPIHMQNGRDEGPLANPSHYFIFFGILTFLHAGILSMALARDPLPRGAVRLSPSWRVPRGSLIAVAAGLIALVGFPADDLWHRLFGQDVTEWGPTHVMMIGGAVTCILAVPLLLAEAHQVGAPGTRTTFGRWRFAVALSLCIAPFAFLMEFDLGVPQFPAATQFIIVGFLAAWIFTAVRLWFGPGGALLAWGVYTAAHLFLMVTVWALGDVLVARWLLLLPAAVIVEAVALIPGILRRPLRFGVISGVLIGTIGLFAEWLWSDVFMPLPQPLAASSLPLMLATGTLAAIGGGMLAAWHVAHIHAVAGTTPADVEQAAPDGAWWLQHRLALGGVGAFVVLMAALAPPAEGPALTADVSYSDIARADGSSQACAGDVELCMAVVTVRLTEPDALDDAIWFYGLAWQGRGPHGDTNVPGDPQGAPGVVRVAMEPTGEPGEFRSVGRLPLYGNFKTLIRAHLAPRDMFALALYAPDDPAIESARGRQIVVEDGDTATFMSEKQFLQREIKDDTPAWLDTAAHAVVIAMWLALLLFYMFTYGGAARAARRPVPAEV
ncbi:hypothetical protein [Nocardioides limicola]|uniref:hypothetical protein n=1 Tax=Nocardioides limicola TaxID=2803368 RepID=UPI00193BA1FA|nr:hypothetical protein [Nocardioides sp. DJM-14]